MNIQEEVQKIHAQFGVSEMANYKIEQLVEKAVKEAQQWIPVEDELPKALEKVLVKIANKVNVQVTTAQFVPAKTILAEDFLDPDYSDSEQEEYDEDKDVYYVVTGWYENTYEADVNYYITDKITHWRPIEYK